VYGALIAQGTRSTSAPQADQIQFVVGGSIPAAVSADPRITTIGALGDAQTLLATARYDGFRDVILDLARRRSPLRIVEIAGNDEILITGTADAAWQCASGPGQVVYSLPIVTDPGRKRFTMKVPVAYLIPMVAELIGEPGVVVDHIYDY
jgi:hypothetical protein